MILLFSHRGGVTGTLSFGTIGLSSGPSDLLQPERLVRHRLTAPHKRPEFHESPKRCVTERADCADYGLYASKPSIRRGTSRPDVNLIMNSDSLPSTSPAAENQAENVVQRLRRRLREAQQMGFEVRREWLEDQQASWCEIGGKRTLFVDLSQTAAEQLRQIDESLAAYSASAGEPRRVA